MRGWAPQAPLSTLGRRSVSAHSPPDEGGAALGFDATASKSTSLVEEKTMVLEQIRAARRKQREESDIPLQSARPLLGQRVDQLPVALQQHAMCHVWLDGSVLTGLPKDRARLRPGPNGEAAAAESEALASHIPAWHACVAMPVSASTALVTVKHAVRTTIANAYVLLAQNHFASSEVRLSVRLPALPWEAVCLLPAWRAVFQAPLRVSGSTQERDETTDTSSATTIAISTMGAFADAALKALPRSTTLLSVAEFEAKQRVEVAEAKAFFGATFALPDPQKIKQEIEQAKKGGSSAVVDDPHAFVGVIPPPDEMKLIEDSVPKFVGAKKGRAHMEAKVSGNPLFGFVDKSHKSHAYYLWAIARYNRMREGGAAEGGGAN